MKRFSASGYILFAITAIGIGATQLITREFNKGLLPVPALMPGEVILAVISGILFVGLGCAVFARKTRFQAAIALGFLYLLFFLVLHIPKLLSNSYDGGEWTAIAEVFGLACGSFMMSGLFLGTTNLSPQRNRLALKLLTFSKYGFAVSLVVFGILHFKYAAYIATLIPAWIPGSSFFPVFIGVAFIATFLSIAINKLVSLSSGLLALMFLLWVVVLHLPRVAGKPTVEAEWTSMFVAMAFGAAGLMLCCLTTPSTKQASARPAALHS